MVGTVFSLKEYGKRTVLGRLSGLPVFLMRGARLGGQAAAEAIVRKAREEAPILKELEQIPTHRHQALRAGALRDSIRAERVGKDTWIVGSDLIYAYNVEYGADHPGVEVGRLVWYWDSREGRYKVHRAGIPPHKIPANPFMRRTLQWAEKKFYLDIGRYAAKEVRRNIRG